MDATDPDDIEHPVVLLHLRLGGGCSLVAMPEDGATDATRPRTACEG